MSIENIPSRLSFSGRTSYEQALDELIANSQRSVQIFDASLSVAYNSPRRIAGLRRLLLTSRLNRLQIVVHDASTAERNCPRLVNLLREFTHAIAIHCTQSQAKGVYDPFAICDERHCVRRFHFDDLRGELINDDPMEAHALAERFTELWAASDQAISATCLGL